MAKFLTPLCVQNADASDDGNWKMITALVYQSDVANQVFTVPAGFETNFASVPRWPIVYWLCGGTSNEAAALHDRLYSLPHPTDRRTADAVLLEASKVTGVAAWRRWLMWAGVRCFGRSHWDIAASIATAALPRARQ